MTDRKLLKQKSWPFPPTTGPIPWTQQQQRKYAQEQREKVGEAPFILE